MNLPSINSFQSLYQLAVALNLGFGALLVFGEPTRKRVIDGIASIEIFLETMIETKNDDAGYVGTIFEVGMLYLSLRREFLTIQNEWRYLISFPVRAVSISLSFIAVVLLIEASVGEHEASLFEFFAAILLNGLPLIVATAAFRLSYNLSTRVIPRFAPLHSKMRVLRDLG